MLAGRRLEGGDAIFVTKAGGCGRRHLGAKRAGRRAEAVHQDRVPVCVVPHDIALPRAAPLPLTAFHFRLHAMCCHGVSCSRNKH